MPRPAPRHAERWPSGRRRTPGKCVYVTSVSWVRIPPAPPDDVRAEFGSDADSQELLWSIGNLALAEKSINTSLGRRPFSYKRTIYPRSQFLLTRVLGKKHEIGNTAIDRAVAHMTPFETWTRSDIAQREAWQTNLACNVSGVPLGEAEIAELA